MLFAFSDVCLQQDCTLWASHFLSLFLYWDLHEKKKSNSDSKNHLLQSTGGSRNLLSGASELE